MTGVSLSAPIDAGLWACESLFGSATPTKALTKSINDDNVFIFFQGQINRGAGFVLEIYFLNLRRAAVCKAIKVILLRPCCSEKPQPAGATFQELVCVVQVGNNLITCFFLSCFKGETIFSNSSNEPHSRLLLVRQQHQFFLIYGLVLCIKLRFSLHFSSHCTISFMDNKCPLLCLGDNSFLL